MLLTGWLSSVLHGLVVPPVCPRVGDHECRSSWHRLYAGFRPRRSPDRRPLSLRRSNIAVGWFCRDVGDRRCSIASPGVPESTADHSRRRRRSYRPATKRRLLERSPPVLRLPPGGGAKPGRPMVSSLSQRAQPGCRPPRSRAKFTWRVDQFHPLIGRAPAPARFRYRDVAPSPLPALMTVAGNDSAGVLMFFSHHPIAPHRCRGSVALAKGAWRVIG